MATTRPCSRIARFDQFEVDIASGELRKSGVRVPLQDQPFQILRLLVEAAPEVLTREQINTTLWPPDTFVDFDLAVNTAVRKLRQALDDSVDHPKFIQTLAKRGYRFISSVEWVAETVPPSPANHIETATPEVRPHTSSKPPSWLVRNQTYFFIFAGLLISAAIVGVIYFRPKTEGPPVALVPLTSLPGQEISPSFSPDGSQVAFGWDGENNGAGFDLYIKVIGTDKPLRLTNHPTPWLGVAWSPDGRYIAVRRAATADSGVFLIPPLGGPERKVASTSDIGGGELLGLSWSPDTRQIAFAAHPPSTGPEAFQIFLLSLSNLETIPLETSCEFAYDPAFSPDGTKLAYVCSQDAVEFSLRLRELQTGKDTELLTQSQNINGIAWSRDGTRIVFSCHVPAFVTARGGNLCQVAPGKKAPLQNVPFGHDAAAPTVSSSGDRLAYAESHGNANIWRVDLDHVPVKARVLAPSTRRQFDPVISPDGKRIVFMSDRSGDQEIWVSDSNGGNLVQLTSLHYWSTGTPHWSPDSRRIVFDSRVGGAANIYIADADGSAVRKVETGTSGNSLPSWSHDGRWIYFASGPADSSLTVWRVPSEGGRATQVVKTLSSMPVESSDGRYVYFVRTTADKVRLWRIRPDGSDEQIVSGVPPLATNGYEWWLAGTGVYFYAYPNNKAEVDFFDFRTSRISHIYTPEKSPTLWLGGLSVSPDSKWLVYSRIDDVASDLMMIENFR